MNELLKLLALPLEVDLACEAEEELEGRENARRLDRLLNVVDVERALARNNVYCSHCAPLNTSGVRVVVAAPLIRALLVEAAWALLRWKTQKTQGLYEWATRIAVRRGRATAAVALARKLAGIMFAIWRDGTEFNPEHMTSSLVTTRT